jgi:SMODS and SLOG-associating 2TM effector domain 2
MQPDDVPRCAGGPGGAGRHGGSGDLRPWAFPSGDWGEPAERLEELYRWAEQRALRTAEWYLHDRAGKRRWARGLRLAAVVLAAAGAGVPLFALATHHAAAGPWGYVALAAAAGCAAVDRWFGFTSGWVRDVGTAQAVQRRLEAFQFDWAAESIREVLGPTEGTASEAAERCLGVLRRFCEDVSETVRAETTQWVLEFRPSLVRPEGRASASWPPPPGRAAPGQDRLPLPPGSRPSMPRQRPPEAPR